MVSMSRQSIATIQCELEIVKNLSSKSNTLPDLMSET
jgi:hypothetical protein